MNAQSFTKEELQLLALSLEHCLATCKEGEQHPAGGCPDCAAATALLEKIRKEMAP